MAITHGVGISWGVDTTIAGVNGAFQSRDHSFEADAELIKDGGDTTVSKVYWDARELASFTWVAVQASAPYGDAYVSLPTLGEWVYLTDGRYGRIEGWWLVDDIKVLSSNTTATRVTLQLSRYPYLARV